MYLILMLLMLYFSKKPFYLFEHQLITILISTILTFICFQLFYIYQQAIYKLN